MKKRSVLNLILAVALITVVSCKKEKDEESYSVNLSTPTQKGAKATFTITKGTGDVTPTEYGMVYSKSSAPTVNDTKITITGDSETKTIKGLDLSTTYYARGFVTDSKGTHYSKEVTFTTHCLDVDSIVPRSAPIGATVTVYGRGFGNIANNLNVIKVDLVGQNYNYDYPSSITNTTLEFTIPNTFVVGRNYYIGVDGNSSAPCDYLYDYSETDTNLKLTITN